MNKIRQFVPDDISAVCALRRRVFERTVHSEAGDLERYYHELFFKNPLVDAGFPSYVAEGPTGSVIGFIGVMQRPMSFRGQSLKMAIGTEFMVDPSHRGLVGLELMRRHLNGPQDLSFADSANHKARVVWEGLRGETARIYCLDWFLPLQKWRLATAGLIAGRVSRRLQHWLSPVCRVMDRLTEPATLLNQSEVAPNADDAIGVTAEKIARLFPGFSGGRSLVPVYSEPTVAWLIAQLAAKRRFGILRSRLVRDDSGRDIGWFIYFLNRGGVSQVLQIAAARGRAERVMQSLVADAIKEGVKTLTGRMDPVIMSELGAIGSTVKFAPAYALIHSRNPEVLACIHRGDAFLSRLEGEWCVNS